MFEVQEKVYFVPWVSTLYSQKHPGKAMKQKAMPRKEASLKNTLKPIGRNLGT